MLFTLFFFQAINVIYSLKFLIEFNLKFCLFLSASFQMVFTNTVSLILKDEVHLHKCFFNIFQYKWTFLATVLLKENFIIQVRMDG